MNESYNVEHTTDTTNKSTFICPVCRQTFTDLIAYAAHVNKHGEEEKKRKAEEEKQRKEDQKKLDKSRLDKLRKMYEDSYTAYMKAKDEYESNYSESYYDFGNVLDSFKELFDNGWGRWR